MKLITKFLLPTIVSISCFGCSNAVLVQKDAAPSGEFDLAKVKNAVPRVEKLSPYGNPPTYTAAGKLYHVLPTAQGYDKVGYASWYGRKFHGKETSTHETYDMYAMTAASTELPIPCYVRVTNLENNRVVIVRVNDRGPFRKSRLLDLSYAAAMKLGYQRKGTALVQVEAIDPRRWRLEHHLKVKRANKGEKTVQAYLQVGAFSNEEHANQFAEKLHNAVRMKTKVDVQFVREKPMYRVELGPIRDVEMFDVVQKKLEAAGMPRAVVVAG